jgi:hypothetical protein
VYTWQNNHAILHGCTVFYNKKCVQTSKTKPTITKPIRFYYVVMGADKPAPTVLSDQGFYQLLWDAIDRSNCSLKRTAPLKANKASATLPPTKKANASSSMPISPEPPNNHPLPNHSRGLGRWRFQASDSLSQVDWSVSREAKKGVRDIQLGNCLVVLDVPNRYDLVVDSDLPCFRKERGLVTASKDVLDQKSN